MMARLRLPAAYGFREFADAGGLMSYGPNLPDMYRQSAGRDFELFAQTPVITTYHHLTSTGRGTKPARLYTAANRLMISRTVPGLRLVNHE